MLRRTSLIALAVLLLAAPLYACTIPVFRYALERWDLSAYEILVFHKVPLGDDSKALLKKVEAGPPSANIRVELLDVDREISKSHRAVLERFGKAQPLPWVAVRVIDADDKQPPAWSGPLNADNLKSLVESPARHRMVEKLSRGETAVFLFLESGDKAVDDPARALLTKELIRLEKAIQLPEQSPEGPQLKTGLPLKVGFTVMPIRRDDRAEETFVKILLASEEDLDKVKGPIVLPVFGRGRLLCSLYDKDINATQIANVTRFLCGECSCQVKELNPGVDLLLPANWPELLEKAGPPASPRPDTPSKKKAKS